MEYIFITVFQLVGIAWRSLQDLDKLVKDKSNSALTHFQALTMFWKSQFFSLIGSILVLLTQTTIHWAAKYFYPPFDKISIEVNGFSFPIVFFIVVICAAILGYKGQEIFFKIFNSGSQKAMDYVDQKLGK